MTLIRLTLASMGNTLPRGSSPRRYSGVKVLVNAMCLLVSFSVGVFLMSFGT